MSFEILITGEELAQVIAAATLLITLISFIHQKKTSYPKILIKALSSKNPTSKVMYQYVFSRLKKTMYLVAKFKAFNFSPMEGSVSNIALQYNKTKKIFALSSKEKNSVPIVVQNAFKTFSDNTIKIPALKETDLVFTFELNQECVNTRKFTLCYSYMKNKQIDKKVTFNIPHGVPCKIIDL